MVRTAPGGELAPGHPLSRGQSRCPARLGLSQCDCRDVRGELGDERCVCGRGQGQILYSLEGAQRTWVGTGPTSSGVCWGRAAGRGPGMCVGKGLPQQEPPLGVPGAHQSLSNPGTLPPLPPAPRTCCARPGGGSPGRECLPPCGLSLLSAECVCLLSAFHLPALVTHTGGSRRQGSRPCRRLHTELLARPCLFPPSESCPLFMSWGHGTLTNPCPTDGIGHLVGVRERSGARGGVASWEQRGGRSSCGGKGQRRPTGQ